ncbi:MAG: MFS transporter [Acetobacter sp.]|nr:MFS transporter [Acetobacter sp.]MCH4089915.1 MFS transporter [Acetobacter sp.]MCI1298611.1 MFS transporter [Acetobacter sp.]MCI1315176.1 MFS transporter [Acetobacter sp.]
MAGTTWRRVAVCAATVMMCVICYGDRAALSVALPDIVKDFGLSPSQAGWVLSSFLWSYFFLNLPSSILLDRLGPRLVGILAVAVWSAAMVQGSLAMTLPAFLLSRVVLGVGEAPTFALGAKVMRLWSSPHQRGLMMTLFTSGISIGLASGALVAGYMVAQHGWRMTFIILSLVGFLWCLLWYFLYPPRTKATEKSIKKTRFSLRPFFASRSFWGVVIAQCCVNYANFLMMSWLPVILKQRMNLSVFDASVYTAYCYAGAVIISLVAGRIGESLHSTHANTRSGRKRIVALYLSMVSVLGILPFIHSVPLSMVCLILSMGFVTAGSGANMALLADLLVEHDALGAANGLVLTFSNGTGILAPVITGYILEFTGSFEYVFYMVAAIVLAGAGAILTFPRIPIKLDTVANG